MTEASSPPAEPPPPEASPSFARTLLQFFVIPMGVVAVGVGLFVGFAWLVSDETNAEYHLARLRSGGEREKRQAAFELANRIQHGEPGEFAGLGPELLEAFEEAPVARAGESWVRQYLALALGALGESTAAPALARALDDPDGTVRVYAAWALGAVGGPVAVEALVRGSRAEDPGLRTMSVYGLGALGDPAGREALLRAVDDPVFDVSVNAVVALARTGDAGAEDRLLGMMEADAWEGAPGMTAGERAFARLAAVRAAAGLDSAAVREGLRRVADGDPDLRIREAALAALAAETPVLAPAARDPGASE